MGHLVGTARTNRLERLGFSRARTLVRAVAAPLLGAGAGAAGSSCLLGPAFDRQACGLDELVCTTWRRK
jgi:hypothetical protein